MGTFASNATGSHRAPPHATLYENNREVPHQNPQFWHLVPNRALLRVFPPSGTLFHFLSPRLSVFFELVSFELRSANATGRPVAGKSPPGGSLAGQPGLVFHVAHRARSAARAGRGRDGYRRVICK
jgi:hypothetical protein